MKKEMKRKSKRVIALILALCCMISMNLTAFAASTGEGYMYYDPAEEREVYVDGNLIEAYTMFEWDRNGTVNFSFRQGGEAVLPYAVAIYHFDQDNATIYEQLKEADVVYTPISTADFEVEVFWTQEEYEFAMFYPEDDSECIVSYYVGGNGSAVHQPVSGERVKTYGNQTKVILPVDVMELTFHVEPAEGETLEHCAYYDEEEHIVTEIQNGKLTVPLEYYDTYVEFYFSENDVPAENPGVILNYASDRISATINGESLTEEQFEYYFEEHPADSYVIEFETKEIEGETLAIHGISVEKNGKIEFVQNTGSSDHMTYVIEDASKFYCIYMIDYEYPFQNQMLVDYEDEYGQVYVNGELWEAHQAADIQEKPIAIEFKPAEEGAYPYAVHIYNEVDGELHTEFNLSDETFNYTPVNDIGFFVEVYWTQEKYDFVMTAPEEDEIQIELHVSGNGTVTPLVGNEAEIKTWENHIKIIMPPTDEIDLQIEPMEGEIFEFAGFSDREYHEEDLKNGILTLPLNPEMMWYGGDIVFSENAVAPGVAVWRDTEFVQVECNGEVFGEDEYERIFENAEAEYVLTFTAKENANPDEDHNIRGIAVTVDGERQFIKNADSSKPMQYTIPDNSKWYEIEVITWDTPFNGEYMAYYRADKGTVYVNGQVCHSDVAYETPDGEMKFTFDSPEGKVRPYSIIIWDCVTDEKVVNEVLTEDTLTFVPEGETPYMVEIFWSKEEHDYVNLQEQDGEKILWYTTNGMGSTVAHKTIEGERAASWDGFTKVAIPYATQKVQFQIKLAEGEKLEAIIRNGESVPLYKVQNGVLTLDYSNPDENWMEVEFVFGEKGDEPPVEGLLGDVNLDGTIDTTDAQAIFNHFMGIAPLSDQAYALADLTGDGAIDTSDAQAAFNIFMGI